MTCTALIARQQPQVLILIRKVCHCLGYTQSYHAWSKGWWGACSSQGFPSGGKQVSNVLLPMHHKNSTMLPSEVPCSCHQVIQATPRIMPFPLGSHVCQQMLSHCIHCSSPSNSPQVCSLKEWLQPMYLHKDKCPWNVGVSVGCVWGTSNELYLSKHYQEQTSLPPQIPLMERYWLPLSYCFLQLRPRSTVNSSKGPSIIFLMELLA